MSASESTPEFEGLLQYLKRSRGFDFTGYKRSSLMRRVLKRMQSIEINDFSDYMDYLEVHPQEFIYLFNTILINVTSFFRDRSTWEFLSTDIIPRIINRKQPNEPIRVWSACCASGEEAYTLAMVLAEVLGIEQFRERVKIYATDVDEEALNVARLGIYSSQEVSGLTPSVLEQYFERIDQRYVFRKELRRVVIFGRHNLIQDAPISRIDLLTCRNALMYFNAEAQAKILTRFHFALNDEGYIFLGKAEMLLSHNNSFTPIDLKRRIFVKASRNSNPRDRLFNGVTLNNTQEVDYLNNHIRIRDAALDSSPVAQIVVDINGLLVLANEKARSLFSINLKDLSRPLQDLEISYRPLELRSGIEQAYIDRRNINSRDVFWKNASGEIYYLDVQITPLLDLNVNVIGVSITFSDVSRYRQLQGELEHSNQELEMAYEELQSTNEELETTNEELQSTVEELETTNEELQSTNEELETMNEELQSTNEELHTINDELRQRSDELNEVNSYLSSILASFRGGVIVIDRELQIKIWNHKAEDLWGLRDREVQGKHLLNLDIGLPLEQLRQPIRACLASESDSQEIMIDAINRRGKKITCRLTCTPLINLKNNIIGVIILMEEQLA